MTELIALDVILVIALIVAICGLVLRARQVQSLGHQLMKTQQKLDPWELAMKKFAGFRVIRLRNGPSLWQVAVLDDCAIPMVKRAAMSPQVAILLCDNELAGLRAAGGE